MAVEIYLSWLKPIMFWFLIWCMLNVVGWIGFCGPIWFTVDEDKRISVLLVSSVIFSSIMTALMSGSLDGIIKFV